MRTRFLVVLGVALLCSGCLRATTLITVRPDGSGTIDQELGMTALAAGFIKGFGDTAGDKDSKEKSKPEELFTEEQARKMGEEMGVRFVSGEPVKNGQMEGYRAKYAFDDITKLTLNKDAKTGAPLAAGPAKSTVPPFGFEFVKGTNGSTLVINMPPMDASEMGQLKGLAGQGDKPSSEAENKQALTMMKMMMQGTFVDVALVFEGKIRKANVPVANDGRVTLMQVDFDKLLADPAAMEKLNKARDAKALQNIPGITIPLESKLTIEFAR